MNPLVPGPVDILLGSLSALGLVLTVVALLNWAAHARRLGARTAVLWLLGIVFIPVAGAVAWFSLGRTRRSVTRRA
jgi:hypothetical protein